jgi:hypothetical protein
VSRGLGDVYKRQMCFHAAIEVKLPANIRKS